MKLKWQSYPASLLIAATSMILLPIGVKAEVPQTNSNCSLEAQSDIAPQTLATMAYRGDFKKEGIPGYYVLETEFSAGKITAKEIVQAAVNACVLRPQYDVARHNDYVNQVKNEIELMIQEED
ncbi:hypothetical protein [Crocosphaera sp. Alani8]|uniref:hypothetical protein n=1 Tax=Crocosphaera sp. Alani8 TaxID=3038952 RepID=UPI00313B98CC